MANRLQKRNTTLFEKCVSSKASGNHSRALIYANECAEIRKIAKIVINGQLALEQVILRLETVEELGDIFVQMGPLANIVQEIQGQLTGVLPEVSYELGEINSALTTAVLEAGNTTEHPVMPIPISDEAAQKVLAEANAIADQRLKERFPVLPDGLDTIDESISESIEEQVYEYITSERERTISLSACASTLNVSPKLVEQAIRSLTEKNRIMLEEATS